MLRRIWRTLSTQASFNKICCNNCTLYKVLIPHSRRHVWQSHELMGACRWLDHCQVYHHWILKQRCWCRCLANISKFWRVMGSSQWRSMSVWTTMMDWMLSPGHLDCGCNFTHSLYLETFSYLTPSHDRRKNTTTAVRWKTPPLQVPRESVGRRNGTTKKKHRSSGGFGSACNV